MKKINRPNGLAHLFRCLLLVALGSTATATLLAQSDDDGGPGNQDCNTTSPELPAGPITGTASSTRWGDDDDHGSAESGARYDVKDQVAAASGVVCDLCEPGRRCRRKTSLTSGDWKLDFTYIEPVEGEHDGGWKCDATWTGKYKVECEKC